MPPSSQIAVIFLAGLLVRCLPQPMGRTSWPSWMFAIVFGLSYYFEKALGNELFHVPKIKSPPLTARLLVLMAYSILVELLQSWNRMEGKKTILNQALNVRASQSFLLRSSSFSWINTTCCISFFNF